MLQVLSCLSDSKASIKNEACRKEVTYLEKLEVNDFRTDMVLAEACRPDVAKFCSKVEPGEGRVHTCLRDNAAQLSQACRWAMQTCEPSSGLGLRPVVTSICGHPMGLTLVVSCTWYLKWLHSVWGKVAGCG